MSLTREMIQETLQGLIETKYPQLKDCVIVRYEQKCPFLFAAHEYKGNLVIVETSLWLTSPGFYRVLEEVARAALEIRRGLTSASILREVRSEDA